MPCSADSAAATTAGGWPATVNVTTPMLSTAPPNSECTVTPGIARRPWRSWSVSAASAAATASRSACASTWQAVASATAPGTLGEPASCRSGTGLKVVASSVTEAVAPPPIRYGGAAASQSARPTSAPAPYGAYSLCPDSAT